LAFEDLDPVQVALDRAGAVGKGQAVGHRLVVTPQPGGEGMLARQVVGFHRCDPAVEPVAV
jgi:hypothetical protein